MDVTHLRRRDFADAGRRAESMTSMILPDLPVRLRPSKTRRCATVRRGGADHINLLNRPARQSSSSVYTRRREMELDRVSGDGLVAHRESGEPEAEDNLGLLARL
jgi:hypothetical protein